MGSRLRVIKGTVRSTGAAATEFELRPEQGKQWRIIRAEAYHTDATARISGFTQMDHGVEAFDWQLISLAQNVHISLNREYSGTIGQNTQGPFLARYDVYPKFSSDAVAANSFVRVNALVEEIDGVPND